MNKFTPGPWRIGAMESGRYAVDGANGEEVTGFIDKGDARLIAAAPLMYDALRAIAELHGGEENMSELESTLYEMATKARETLAKVDG